MYNNRVNEAANLTAKKTFFLRSFNEFKHREVIYIYIIFFPLILRFLFRKKGSRGRDVFKEGKYYKDVFNIIKLIMAISPLTIIIVTIINVIP